MQTTGDKARKTLRSHKELQCKQWVMKEDSHKELFCKKWEMKQGRLFVHTRCKKCKQWVMKEGRLIVHTRSYNANNG
ncbi:hypothetical protein KSS87_016571 [Heliosperma pusillum]|nr:hypothetical protein KSS87_016571 [Heliosperma pusillum]